MGKSKRSGSSNQSRIWAETAVQKEGQRTVPNRCHVLRAASPLYSTVCLHPFLHLRLAKDVEHLPPLTYNTAIRAVLDHVDALARRLADHPYSPALSGAVVACDSEVPEPIDAVSALRAGHGRPILQARGACCRISCTRYSRRACESRVRVAYESRNS